MRQWCPQEWAGLYVRHDAELRMWDRVRSWADPFSSLESSLPEKINVGSFEQEEKWEEEQK